MSVRYYISIFMLTLLCNSKVVRSHKHLTTATLQVKTAFDNQFYESFIDDELCDQQTELLVDKSLDTPFLDASSKIPAGILTGNKDDLGDYHQCISIKYDDLNIQGKYCAMMVTLDQLWPDIQILNNITTRPKYYDKLPPNTSLSLSESLANDTFTHNITSKTELKSTAKRFSIYQQLNQQYNSLSASKPRLLPSFGHIKQGFTVAICIPKVCSSERGLKFLQKDLPLNVSATESYCRLSDDKPYISGDYVAIIIFSLLGLLNAVSTTYELVTKFYLKRELSERSTFLCSFSVYTNTRRLLTFSSGLGQLDCIDGIRAISMIFVVLRHSYAFILLGYVHNVFDVVKHLQSIGTIWIIAIPISVDTFFALTGILIVYISMGKFCRAGFFRNLHMFYLHRLLRMFPLLAAQVLFQATLAHHMADGPFWVTVASHVQNCRNWWWSALLHVQNYVNPTQPCLLQTWYLSVDTQLYFISPLVMWFLWGQRWSAWAALGISLLLSLVSTSYISFTFNFSAAALNVHRADELEAYLFLYYCNILARAPPFFVGMACGYVLHVYREKDIKMSKINVTILWLLTLLVMVLCVYSFYLVMQPDHTAQTFDNFLNAYIRAIWAAALGWIIFACDKGYGGPVNWLLSLQVWKLPARLSFAVYLLHITLIMLVDGVFVQTHYFTFGDTMYRFFSDLTIAFIAAFVVCITIDAPFSTLQKLMLKDGKEKATNQNQRIVIDLRPTIKVSEFNLKTSL